MDSEELLKWYDAVCDIFQGELDENSDLITTPLFYWADELYNNMDYRTKELSKVQ